MYLTPCFYSTVNTNEDVAIINQTVFETLKSHYNRHTEAKAMKAA